eukprot:7391825-Prymnesium_polylepis.2
MGQTGFKFIQVCSWLLFISKRFRWASKVSGVVDRTPHNVLATEPASKGERASGVRFRYVMVKDSLPRPCCLRGIGLPGETGEGRPGNSG